MLSSALQKKISQFLDDNTSHKNWLIHKDKIHAREGNIYRFSTKESSYDIAAKIFHQHLSTANALSSLKTLKRFDESLNALQLPYRTPKPIDDLSGDHKLLKNHCVLMQWIEGKPLEERLWRYFYRKNIQQNDIKKAYYWLKHYHQVANPLSKPACIDYFTEQLDQHIEQHHGHSLLSNNPTFAKGITIFKTQSALFSNLVVPYADIHGDFTPSNLILDDSHTTAIDIGGGQSLPVVVDMALMLNYLSIEYFLMLTKGDMKLPPSQWPLLKLIFDAYEYPKNHEQYHFFLFVFQYQMLRRWLVIANRDPKKQRSSFVERRRKVKSEIIVAGLNKALLRLEDKTNSF